MILLVCRIFWIQEKQQIKKILINDSDPFDILVLKMVRNQDGKNIFKTEM